MQIRSALTRVRGVIAACLLAVSTGVHGADLHPLWAVKGAHNTVYLLGSIHALRPADGVLGAEMLRAYASAHDVVMETSLDDEAALQRAVFDRGILPAGQTLADALGKETYAKFVGKAQALGVDADFMSHFQPWLAMTLLEQLKLAGAGVDPTAGIDLQISRRARADGKRVIGLETIDDHVGLLANMPLDEQRQYVAGSLAQLDDTVPLMQRVVDAWKRGDATGLAQSTRATWDAVPAVEQRIVLDRNRKWIDALVKLLADDQDHLVVVGALHLVGNGSVIDLLQKRGYTVEQQ